MKTIEPAELSAYLDGELNSDRASEVSAVIADDPTLRVAFDALATMDAAWKTAAKSAAFTPAIRLPTSRRLTDSRLVLAVVLALLVALRMAPILGEHIEWDLSLHVIALMIVLLVLIRSGGQIGYAS
jgi:anti-sigma factor RsiW